MTVRAEATPFAIPLRRALRAGGQRIATRHGVLLALTDDDGHIGLGEAAPRPAAAPPDWRREPTLRHALETAWLDLEARAAGVPLAVHLGGRNCSTVAVNGLLDATSPAACARQAAAFIDQGVRCLKLKLDAHDLDAGCRRLAAVRNAVGDTIALRVDVNAAWSVADAIAALERLADFALEYVEQPVATIAELADVQRAVAVPLAADEVVTDVASVAAIAAAGAARVIVIKPALLGVRRSLAIAAAARNAGLDVVVTSTLDSTIGIASAAHVAAASGTQRPCGLATAALLRGDLASAPLPIIKGMLHLPSAPGIGVACDPAALARWQTGPTQRLADFLATRPSRKPQPRARRNAPPAERVADTTVLTHRARTHAAHPALITDDETIDFATLAARVAGIAARLHAAGIRRGDRVALLIGPSPAFVELLHAVTALGAVAVPLAPQLTPDALAPLLGAAGCAALCYADARAAALAARTEKVLRIAVGSTALPGDMRLDALPAARVHDDLPQEPDTPHSVIFTSGSTGTPTPILLSTGNHLWNALASATVLGVRDDDRWLGCLPMNHVGGLSILLRSVVLGIPVVLHERFDPVRVNAAIDGDHVTLVSLVPTMLQRVLAARGDRPFPPHLRAVLLGGAPASRALLAACAARQVPVAVTYGMTEAASQIATAPPETAATGRALAPLPGTVVRIVRRGRPRPAGEVGEIEVRGPTIGRRLGTGIGARRDWLRTRDLGSLDADGALTVVGRADDVIITGGENVHPRPVEDALEAHPGIAEACVFGLPDPDWGELVCAAVLPAPGAPPVDPEAIITHARTRLAPAQLPRRVTIVRDFPRTASGKILRHAVRAAAATLDRHTSAPE